jgi:hypothetical protein
MIASRTTGPLVSFVVPCYKHGHFLLECVQSILGQTYTNIEVIVMDDCSPDDTPVIGRSFRDPRVRYVRNEVNLGHLANYNKGIGLAQGTYVWLINVDDYLRRSYVVERFVDALERTPDAAYVFCPAVQVHDGHEGAVFGRHGDKDQVFRKHAFLDRLLVRNRVPTPAAMVRKASYDRMGMFEFDLPYAGDWYQWCRHALYGDVVYLAEPMACYRFHELNMSKEHFDRPAIVIADETAVRWRTKRLAEQLGLHEVAQTALDAIATDYANRVTRKMGDASKFGMTFEEFAASLDAHQATTDERIRITGAVLAGLGDHYYHHHDTSRARQFYLRALKENPRDLRTWVKGGLLAAGPVGRTLRAAVAQKG